jgi:hypothetical protein
MGLFLYRMLGAALLDASMYEGLEADRRATPQAFATVALVCLAAGFGLAEWRGSGFGALALVAAIAFVAWLAWAMLMFQLGTRVLPGPETHADLGELLRTLGFATSPGFLLALAAVPAVSRPAMVAAFIWMFLAMVIAVRHALDYPNVGRALVVCGLGAALAVALALLIGLYFGPVAS